MLRLRLSRRSLAVLCLLGALLCLLYGTVPDSPSRPAAVVADQPAAALPASTPSTDWFPYVTPPGIATDMASRIGGAHRCTPPF